MKRRVATRRVGIVGRVVPECVQHGEAIADCVLCICGLIGVALCAPQCDGGGCAVDDEGIGGVRKKLVIRDVGEIGCSQIQVESRVGGPWCREADRV